MTLVKLEVWDDVSESIWNETLNAITDSNKSKVWIQVGESAFHKVMMQVRTPIWNDLMEQK